MTVLSSLVVDTTYDRLINYVYNQYSEYRPLSDPPAPPRCALEDFFVVADPQALACPRLSVYPRVEELARESKPLHRVLPLRRRVFHVADDLDYATFNPDFLGSQEKKRSPSLVRVPCHLQTWKRLRSVPGPSWEVTLNLFGFCQLSCHS